jgi:hypothetical protein
MHTIKNNTVNQHFTQAFLALDALLDKCQPLWKPRPFVNQNCGWTQTHPKLQKALEDLTNEQVLQFELEPHQFIDWLKPYAPEIAADLISTSALSKTIFHSHPISLAQAQSNAFNSNGIPGRKWQQIEAFSQYLGHNHTHIIDWCSGKGHLGCELARRINQPTTCLEWDRDLCLAGQQKADSLELNVEFRQHDVLTPLPADLILDNSCHTALHACGDLHISLLQQASKHHATQILVSPCCYHKITSDYYQPLSKQAINSTLKLSRNDLHLATEEVITGGKRIARLRNTEQQWRLAFSFMYQKAHQSEVYFALPSCPKSLFSGDFDNFVRWAIEVKSLSPAPLQNLLEQKAAYLSKALHAQQQIRRLELLRKAFKLPLENWLTLDRALFLEQQGYQVQVSIFCDKKVTPRNIVINALAHR